MEEMKVYTYSPMEEIVSSMMEIYEEIDGAKAYVKEAMMLKDVDRQIADDTLNMSAEELHHAEVLKQRVNKLFSKIEGDPCYDILKKVWGYVCSRQAEYIAWVKHMHEVYKK